MPEQSRPTAPHRKATNDSTKESEIHIEIGGLGELFKGLGNFLDIVGEMAEKGPTEITRTGEVRGPGEVHGVYGFTVRTAVGGQPVVERFGNIRTTERGAEVTEMREPLVDIFDEKDHILVVVELAGVAEKDIKVSFKDNRLDLHAKGRDRQYAKEVELPEPVDTSTLKQTYQNGILELRMNKAGPSQEKR